MRDTHNRFGHFYNYEQARVESPSQILQRTWDTYYHDPIDVTDKMAVCAVCICSDFRRKIYNRRGFTKCNGCAFR